MKAKIKEYFKDILAVQIAGTGTVLMCFGFALIKISVLDKFLKATED